MNRREFITRLSGGTAAWPLAARAQQAKLPRVGVLVLTSADAQSLGGQLREGLQELGYVEGQNFAFEFRSADGNTDRLPQLAAELVRLPVDLIVAAYTPCAEAAKRATTAIPIVMAAVADPIGAGLVQSLARPGGNITGLSNMAAETAGKSLELLRDMLPSLRRVAALANPDDAFTKSFLEQVHLAGRTGSIEIAPVAMVRNPDQVEAAFCRHDGQAGASRHRARHLAFQGHCRLGDQISSAVCLDGAGIYARRWADVVRRRRTSPVSPQRRPCAKDFAGHETCGSAVEQATKFDLVVNIKTAKAMGLTISKSFLVRADEVMELEMRITAVHKSAIALLSRAFPAAGPELAKADIGAPKAHTTMKQGTKNNLTRQGVLRALRRNDELLQKHAVRRIALFGSYASGRQTKERSRFSGRVQAANLQQLSRPLERSGVAARQESRHSSWFSSRNEEMAAFTSRIK